MVDVVRYVFIWWIHNCIFQSYGCTTINSFPYLSYPRFNSDQQVGEVSSLSLVLCFVLCQFQQNAYDGAHTQRVSECLQVSLLNRSWSLVPTLPVSRYKAKRKIRELTLRLQRSNLSLDFLQYSLISIELLSFCPLRLKNQTALGRSLITSNWLFHYLRCCR